MDQVASAVLDIGFARGTWVDSASQPVDNAFRQLREECLAQQALYDAQPPGVRRMLDEQARRIAEALVQGQRQLSFALPEQVSIEEALIAVPVEFRKQNVAGLLSRLPVAVRRDIRAAVRQRLSQLEQSNHPAVAVCARLVRYAVVRYIVNDMLPTGGSIKDSDDGATRRFYMPQWVAFDDERLLVSSLQEAEARVASMQSYVSTLHLAVSLAPYIFAEDEYQRKRSGMLAQLVHQGRALARYQTHNIIGRLGRKAAAHELDRGFSLSVPYFDDQTLETKIYDFQVIPAGRTMFVPAFVVLAARQEQDKIQQNARLSESTRMHLLAELKELERAFDTERSQAH